MSELTLLTVQVDFVVVLTVIRGEKQPKSSSTVIIS